MKHLKNSDGAQKNNGNQHKVKTLINGNAARFTTLETNETGNQNSSDNAQNDQGQTSSLEMNQEEGHNILGNNSESPGNSASINDDETSANENSDHESDSDSPILKERRVSDLYRNTSALNIVLDGANHLALSGLIMKHLKNSDGAQKNNGNQHKVKTLINGNAASNDCDKSG
ncbi:hypothetical protein ACFE04_017996 [Oxalis oulophora]